MIETYWDLILAGAFVLFGLGFMLGYDWGKHTGRQEGLSEGWDEGSKLGIQIVKKSRPKKGDL